jgi:hypothetical protein
VPASGLMRMRSDVATRLADAEEGLARLGAQFVDAKRAENAKLEA